MIPKMWWPVRKDVVHAQVVDYKGVQGIKKYIPYSEFNTMDTGPIVTCVNHGRRQGPGRSQVRTEPRGFRTHSYRDMTPARTRSTHGCRTFPRILSPRTEARIAVSLASSTSHWAPYTDPFGTRRPTSTTMTTLARQAGRSDLGQPTPPSCLTRPAGAPILVPGLTQSMWRSIAFSRT